MLFKFVRVSGDSMSPGIRDGDFVLVSKRLFSSYREDDIVLLNYPGAGQIIKRITERNDDQALLKGDNPKSIQVGWVQTSAILGRVAMHFSQ